MAAQTPNFTFSSKNALSWKGTRSEALICTVHVLFVSVADARPVFKLAKDREVFKEIPIAIFSGCQTNATSVAFKLHE